MKLCPVNDQRIQYKSYADQLYANNSAIIYAETLQADDSYWAINRLRKQLQNEPQFLILNWA